MRQAEETLAEWAGHEAPLVEKLRGVFKAFQIPDHVASQLCVCVCERERERQVFSADGEAAEQLAARYAKVVWNAYRRSLKIAQDSSPSFSISR